MKTIQKQPLNNHHNRKRPSKVRLLKHFAKVEVFNDAEPHLVDLDVAENVAEYRWHKSNKGYAQTKIKGHMVSLHRLVFGLVPRGLQIDHINRDRRDNRRTNLRATTSGLNNHNCAACGSSGFKGVSWAKNNKKWKVEIGINHHSHYLGLFTDEVEAAQTYDRAVIEHYGANAVTNFPHKHYG